MNLQGMMNGIKRYFGLLPISFSNALVATIVVAFIMGLQTYLLLATKTHAVESWLLVRAVYVFPILNYGIWLATSPLLFLLLLKANTHADTLKRNTTYVALGLAFTLGHELLALLIFNVSLYLIYFLNFNDFFELDIKSGVLGLSKTFVEYWVISFLLIHFHSKKKFRQAELRNAQLEAQLVKAQMSALKNQLHPHFLFNSFNTISSLMEEDVPLAQRMIAKLGLLLRKILKDGDVQLVALEDEVEMAKLYLEVEQIRFKGRLVTRFSIDPKVKLVSIPTLLLQPAVENAVKHGFYNKTGVCEISIQAYEEGNFVWIEVADNGDGKKNSLGVSFGMGLTNMKDRLRTSYGEGYELNVNSKSANGGFIVEIKIRKEATKNENINGISG
ncbi:histidine kinase [Ekhidna sp.]|uniref:sensor histidine kinase n=1 Tax=Ekhidna sp. TaxID=2608089 RepID=UPI003298220A